MTTLNNKELIKRAKDIADLKNISEDVRIGDVGCALITTKGQLYLGVSIHACCGIGFCAEHSAIASMVLNKEYRIEKIVAVTGDGTVVPPCGRCRELMYQIDEKNWNTDIIIDTNKVVKLKTLLPEPWQKKFY